VSAKLLSERMAKGNFKRSTASQHGTAPATARLGEAGILSERQRAGSMGCRRFKSCCPDHAERWGYARGSADDGTHLQTRQDCRSSARCRIVWHNEPETLPEIEPLMG
jgi:hypothetical protein